MLNRQKKVGLGQTPPLVWEKFPRFIVFFWRTSLKGKFLEPGLFCLFYTIYIHCPLRWAAPIRISSYFPVQQRLNKRGRKTRGNLWPDCDVRKRREICSDNSRRQTDLAESVVSKYPKMEACHVSFMGQLFSTFFRNFQKKNCDNKRDF